MRACLLLAVFLSPLPLWGGPSFPEGEGGIPKKHPFTFEDMMSLKRVEEPEVSPDGKWVLFAAVDVDLKANTKTPHVWVVPLSSNSEKSGVPHPSPVLARVGNSEQKKAGPSTAENDSQANHSASLGMTGVSGETGGREREIISDQDADRPHWAPNGKRFAFVSTKGHGSQIWIADFDGATGTVTAKHRLTNIATEADGELWSPDGKNILFKSDVYPECDGAPAEEAACNAKKVEEAKNSKVKALIFTHLLYRHWNAYKEGKRTHLFVVAVSAGEGARPTHGEEIKEPTLPHQAEQERGTPVSGARDLTPGDYDAPVFSLGGQDDYAFSPDGQEICYASNHDPVPAISTNNDLFIVPVNGGTGVSPVQILAQTKNITAENKAADNTPLYSPDGKYIAYRSQQRPGYESDRWRLMLYDRKTGEKKELTDGFDHWAENFAWAPDSKTVYFSAEHMGHSLIYAVDTMGGSGRDRDKFSRRVLVGGYNDDLAVTPNGKKLLFTRMSINAPNEVYATDTAGPGCPAMTGNVDPGKEDCNLNKDWPVTWVNEPVLSQVDMSTIESFSFSGGHGDKVEGFLVKPPNFDPNKKYPVKFIVHGGPEVPFGDEWSYRWNFELFAANGYVVVFINFHGSPGYGQKFIDAINGDWGGASFEDLMKGLDYAEAHYGFIDKDRECALGASYGGYMANWILGHTTRFKCIVTHDGMFNAESAWGTTEELWFNEWEFKGTPYTNRELYRKWSPHLSATNFKTPTLVIHSQRDYRLDVSQGFDLFTTLQRQGVPSKMLYFPDEGHWVLKPQNSQLWYKTVNDWVDQWVGK
jgi:dipeptidyl aminopeptidase/acylaminoacyl peptidase